MASVTLKISELNLAAILVAVESTIFMIQTTDTHDPETQADLLKHLQIGEKIIHKALGDESY